MHRICTTTFSGAVFASHTRCNECTSVGSSGEKTKTRLLHRDDDRSDRYIDREVGLWHREVVNAGQGRRFRKVSPKSLDTVSRLIAKGESMSTATGHNTTRAIVYSLVLVVLQCTVEHVVAEEPPLFTFVHIAHPIVTNKVDVPPNRPLSQGIVARLNSTVDAVNRQKPDFAVLTGNLTWSGDEADYKDLKTAVDRIQAPTHLAPGEKDIPDATPDRFQHFFRKEIWYSFDHKNCHFVVVGHFPPEQFVEFVKWLESDLMNAQERLHTIVCGFPFPPSSKQPSTRISKASVRLREILKEHKVTAWFGGPDPWGPAINQPDGVPLVTTPSVAWPPGYSRWTVIQFTNAVVKVYNNRLEVGLQPLTNNLIHEVTLHNPRTTPIPSGPPFLADYQAIVAQQPLLTFVQFSDTQLDDFSTQPRQNHRHRNAPQVIAQAIGEVNLLDPQPAFVTITGDLTNKSTDAEWKQYMDLIKMLKTPVFHVPGNHDVDPPTEHNSDKRMLNSFRHFTGAKSYYSWQQNGAYFIALDSSRGVVNGTQLNWLRAELEKSHRHRYVFALAHHSIDRRVTGTIGKGREEVTLLLREFHANGFLCGHLHIYGFELMGEMLHMVCNDLCWEDGNGYIIYHLFPDYLIACYKPVGQPYDWRFQFSNARSKPPNIN